MNDNATPKRPELLAPAGSMTALHAAVCAGADAVYLGLSDFNARRNADNFTLEALREACDYAHLRGVRVYVTVNIAILPHELERALLLVRDAYLAGADAFIIQDLGLALRVSQHIPQARIHLSTQMNIHSRAGLDLAASLGAARVTLARELSVAEIAALADYARELDIELECFAHGALCICYSGQCLMSSMIGGRSANRGLCAQACRLPYTLERCDADGATRALPADGEHLLSPKDLCTIDILPQLMTAGVASLKIEGRMKSAEYVGSVVSVYRDVLDRNVGAITAHATPQQHQQLAEAFSRGFTTAYLTGERGNDIMSYGRPNNRGVFAGRVTDVRGSDTRDGARRDGRHEDGARKGNARGADARRDDAHKDNLCGRTPQNCLVDISAEFTFDAGDVLEFWTNKGHFTHTVSADEAAYQRAGRATLAVNPQNGRLSKGDRVFRVRAASLAFTDSDWEPRIPITGQAIFELGSPAQVSFSCTVAGQTYYGSSVGDTVEPARTKAVSADDIANHINRLGQTPFVLAESDHVGAGDTKPDDEHASDAESDISTRVAIPELALSISLDDGVGLGFSTVHQLRTEALHDLEQNILSSWHTRTAPQDKQLKRAAAQLSLPAMSAPAKRSAQGITETHPCRVVAWTTHPAAARAAKRAGADAVLVPALNYKRGQSALEGVRQPEAQQAGYPGSCIVALPCIDHDAVGGSFAAADTGTAPIATGSSREAALDFDPWQYVKEAKPVFADSVASCIRAAQAGALVEIGPHVPLTNAASLEAARLLGAQRVWLSPELTLGQIADLAAISPINLGITIYGAQELMVTEHCLLMSQGPCAQNCPDCTRRNTAHHYVDQKGFDFPIVTDMLGRSHLYNGIMLDTTERLDDFINMGISEVMIDATFMTVEDIGHVVGRVVRYRDEICAGGLRSQSKQESKQQAKQQDRQHSRRQGKPQSKPQARNERAKGGQPGKTTTSGHLFRGVQ